MSFKEILSGEQKFAAGDKILTLRRKVIEVHSHSVCCLCNNARAGVYLVECIGFRVTWARGESGARAGGSLRFSDKSHGKRRAPSILSIAALIIGVGNKNAASIMHIHMSNQYIVFLNDLLGSLL